MEVDESSCTKCLEETRYQVNLDPPYWIRNNMTKWYVICTDFSSADPKKQQGAYKSLLDLSSRYFAETPSGMRCTLNFLKVRLQDKMFANRIVEDGLADDVDILREMYMSAIQEFLEILASTNQNSIGIYPLSKKFNLPDWLIEIYHEICHHEKKPSIQKLRAASHLCIDWLRENYWINESRMAASWINIELKVKNELRQMVIPLNKYLVHFFNGNRVISSITEERLQHYVEARCEKYDIAKLQSMRRRLARKKLMSEQETPLSLLVLVKDITEYLKQDSYIHIAENLADVLLEGSCFLPSRALLAAIDPLRYDLHLPISLIKVWNCIFEFLPQNQLLPVMIDKLIELTGNATESEDRKEMAALWVRLLATSLMYVRDALKHLKQRASSISEQQMMVSFDKQLMRMVPDGELLRLRPQLVPPQLTQSSNLMKHVMNPNKWTSVYLRSLLLLLEPRVPQQMEILLEELLRIYTTGNLEGLSIQAVHTVDDLNDIAMQPPKQTDVSKLPWVHSLKNWGNNPLHHELRLLTDELPGGSLWQ